MPYVRDSFWRGRGFTTLAQMQAAAVVWSRDVAGARACRPLDGAAPAAVFAAVEADTMLPLPRRVFELATWSTCTVGPDIHVKVGKALYSVPWRLIGQKLDARATWNTVQLFHKGQLVATHARADTRKRTDLSHYPPEKIAFAMKTPTWCRRRADEIGPHCTAVIGSLLEMGALFRLRAAQGVLGLADKHGPQRLEASCGKAIAAGDPSYRTIRGILAARPGDRTATRHSRRRWSGRAPARAGRVVRQRLPALTPRRRRRLTVRMYERVLPARSDPTTD